MKTGVPKGSRRIPPQLRLKAAQRIRSVMKPYVGGETTPTVSALCKDTAKDLKLHPNTVWFWYEGYTLPTIWNLIRFADLYEVSIDYLLGRTAVRELAHVIQRERERVA